MSKNLFLLLLFIKISVMSIGQIYDMSNTTINTCGGTFYDQGGSSGDYINNQFLVMTFCSSTPGDQIQFNFSAFSTQLNEDYLYIYNGPNTSSPFLGQYSGTNGPGIVTSSNGCLTFVFTSNSSITDIGWAAAIVCISSIDPPCIITGCPSGSIVPTNDNCSGAEYVSIPLPPGCTQTGSGIGYYVVINANNNCASPGNPYQYQQGCQPLGNLAFPAADVWYTFNLTGSELKVIIDGLSNPNIGLYQGDSCNSLIGKGCAIGTGGNLNATFQGLAPGQYYLQVSGGDPSDQCNFTLILQNNNDCDNCVVNQNLTANPPPVIGTYQPGQTVTFCYTISDYKQISGNWLHAVIPGFGLGWDMSTLTGFQPATSCSGEGTWSWYNTQVTSASTGLTIGPGFFYENWQGSPISAADNDPGNNYGDFNLSNLCDWTFCWTITTLPATQCLQAGGLDVSVNSYGDGESGSWAIIACAGDPISISGAISVCCQNPTVTSINGVCGFVNTGSATGEGQGSGLFTYQWIDPSGSIIQSINNTSGLDTINNLGPGTYTFQTTDNSGCISAAYVTITQPPSFSLTTSTTHTICGDSIGSVTVSVNGNTTPYTYYWNGGDTSSSIINLPAGTYIVTVTDSNGCTVTASAMVQSILNAVITASGPATICAGDSVTLNANTGTGLSYQWQLNGNNINGATLDSYSASLSGNYSVNVANSCGNSISNIISVTVTSAPGSAGAISGPSSFCRHSTQSFSVAPVPGATNYVWAVPPQATIISGAGTNSITVEFKVKPGDVTVKPANQCGSGPLSVLSVNLTKCYNPFHPIFRVNSQNEINIYPNPSKSEFNCLISGYEDRTFTITVLDYSGRIVEYNENIEVNESFSFGKNLASGFYFVEINSGEVKEIFKIVKVE